jgi:adenosylmethionine-8-amino-7-oxononanoate aminotransferase
MPIVCAIVACHAERDDTRPPPVARMGGILKLRGAMLRQKLTTEQLRALDKRHVWHPFTHMKLWLDEEPLVITAAEGMHLIDSDGNRYLDGVSSLWCNVHGHHVKEIDDAIRAQLERVAHTTMLGLASEPAILLADRLMKLVPSGLTKVFYSDAGATAAEVAFKLAAQYWYNIGRPEKNEFVGFSEAYHGDTVGAMSVGRTTSFHKPYFPMLFKVHYAPTPFPYRWTTGEIRNVPFLSAAGEIRNVPFLSASAHEKGDISHYSTLHVRDAGLRSLETLLSEHHERLAAVCIEPIVQGAAGMIVHPDGFLRGVRELCTKYDVLLVADEVAVGFGRTGRMFACEHEGVSPDLMCVAKGITGGYLPLAATVATQKIFDAFLGEPWEGKTFFHGHTYTGNPLACAAALASLDLFEKNDLLADVRRKSDALAAMIAPLADLPHVGDVRQKGLMVGIELVADKTTKQPFDPKRRLGADVCARVRRHGVIIRPLGDVIVLMPPLAMPLEDIERIVAAVTHEVAAII